MAHAIERTVATQTQASATGPLPAHLLIHRAGGGSRYRGMLECLLLRLRALIWLELGSDRRLPTGVRIDDLQGHAFFASEDARTLIDVALPAGVYHVNVRTGDWQRRYTVSLAHGASLDLYLRLAANRQ